LAKTEEIFSIVRERFGDGILEEHPEARDPYIVFDPAMVQDLCLFARDDPRLSFDLLSLISTVDYPHRPAEGKKPEVKARIEVVYMLDSTVHRHWLIARAVLDRDNPRIATVENIWRTADWHEREAFDLMGVIFEGHHNLIRILCAEDWEGHPLRKDYVIPATYHGVKNVVY